MVGLGSICAFNYSLPAICMSFFFGNSLSMCPSNFQIRFSKFSCFSDGICFYMFRWWKFSSKKNKGIEILESRKVFIQDRLVGDHEYKQWNK